MLPTGVRARHVRGVNGLTMHILEAGFEPPGRPCVLLLHGFPELAYSWRAVMPALADAGWYVVAPDQRGYGRTAGWDPDYDGDLDAYRMTNLVQDTLALVFALGRSNVLSVIGHDFGSPVAAWCALIRPDVFRSVVLMSAPFAGPPSLPFSPDGAPIDADDATGRYDIHHALAALARPRKHYQWYYSTRAANDDMHRCPQGVHDFLRAYFHHKSADWPDNRPHPLAAWAAEELAKLPTYYVMDHDATMAETVAPEMPAPAEIASCAWLPDEALRVYSEEYERNGFQGGLQWYRCNTSDQYQAELRLYSGRTIDVPACFVAGASDWGVYQLPGAFERMQREVCTQMRGCHLLEGAGPWVQQERPARVSELLIGFLGEQTSARRRE